MLTPGFTRRIGTVRKREDIRYENAKLLVLSTTKLLANKNRRKSVIEEKEKEVESLEDVKKKRKVSTLPKTIL